jgi:hypothetical protein
MAPRSQSTRDIMRQEAKLQEMQEEVRRREMRGGITSPQHYPLQAGGHIRPQVGRGLYCPVWEGRQQSQGLDRADHKVR